MTDNSSPAQLGSILFVHSSDEPFGSDRVLLALVDSAREGDGRVGVLLPDDIPEGWLTEKLVERDIPVWRVPLAVARRRYMKVRSLPRYLASVSAASRVVRRVAEEFGADIVHLSTSALIAGAFVGRPNRCRLFWHVQELVVSPRPIAWLLRVLPMWTADVVIANSEAVAANLRRVPRPRAHLHRVYNGIEPRSAPDGNDKPADPLLCVFAGRLNRWKGYDLFVEAAAKVAVEFPAARFAIAGTPPEGEEWRLTALCRRLTELGIADCTDVLGMCDDVPALFDRAHVVVVPSKWPEPFGLVIIEAMQSRCAVLASDQGGARELVVDGVTGCLVPPNDVDALAAGLAQLLKDDAWRERLALEGSHRAKEAFSKERFSNAIRQLWERGR